MPSPCPVSPIADGVVQWTYKQGLGSVATVHILKFVRLSIESVHSPFDQAVKGGVFGSQHGTVVSVLQTRSSRMFVFKSTPRTRFNSLLVNRESKVNCGMIVHWFMEQQFITYALRVNCYNYITTLLK